MISRRQDEDHPTIWITEEENWEGLWSVYECLCYCGYLWQEVMPEYLKPTICPQCGGPIYLTGSEVWEISRHQKKQKVQ